MTGQIEGTLIHPPMWATASLRNLPPDGRDDECLLWVDRVSSGYQRPAVQPRLSARRPVSTTLPPLAGHKLNGPFGREGDARSSMRGPRPDAKLSIMAKVRFDIRRKSGRSPARVVRGKQNTEREYMIAPGVQRCMPHYAHTSSHTLPFSITSTKAEVSKPPG